MIYLFDDNEYGQMSKNYGRDIILELENFKDIIAHYSNFPEIEKLNDLIKNADFIFIHYSFPPPEVNERICYLADYHNIPLVIFSGGELVTVWDKKKQNIIRKIKKDRFYYNLIPFLNLFQNEKKHKNVSLRNLAYGENYEIERSQIILDSLVLTLSSLGAAKSLDEIFESGSKHYKDLYELFLFAYPENYENQFGIIDDEIYDNNLEVQDLYKKIKELVGIIKVRYEQ